MITLSKVKGVEDNAWPYVSLTINSLAPALISWIKGASPIIYFSPGWSSNSNMMVQNTMVVSLVPKGLQKLVNHTWFTFQSTNIFPVFSTNTVAFRNSLMQWTWLWWMTHPHRKMCIMFLPTLVSFAFAHPTDTRMSFSAAQISRVGTANSRFVTIGLCAWWAHPELPTR